MGTAFARKAVFEALPSIVRLLGYRAEYPSRAKRREAFPGAR